MPTLGLNVDHVATLRQARMGVEPDPAWAAVQGQVAGAQCITMHLREDRRHVQDHDLDRVATICQVKLNLEMAATDEMIAIASRVGPHMSTLVPEGRQEITTEGGLNVAGQLSRMKDVTAALKASGVSPSAFLDADPAQIDAAADAGFEWCEVHTGPFAEKFADAVGRLDEPIVADELAKVITGGQRIVNNGMWFNAGHAINYHNVKPIAQLPGLRELHIGHAIIAQAVFIGLPSAVAEMVTLIDAAAAARGINEGRARTPVPKRPVPNDK
ncbi:MAG: pyridoxine 5'-phosphate synthase [Phycisphaeraceae bacterium]|jgi:pyridoxine 5-phosphate synthase|nr:pyridoxine 5'-phosphate synthase [Phycisphaeraceae bacterium]MDP7346900.1 pyridoxine 5'-phosphate synthase [Phycisphaeraceae bacterium]